MKDFILVDNVKVQQSHDYLIFLNKMLEDITEESKSNIRLIEPKIFDVLKQNLYIVECYLNYPKLEFRLFNSQPP